jgi:hypothetical protein
MLDERQRDVLDRERDPALAQVLAAGAQQGGVAPVQARLEHQPVERIVLRFPRPHGEKALGQRRPVGAHIELRPVGRLQQHIVDEDHAGAVTGGIPGGRLVCALLDGPEAHIGEDGQASAERDRLVAAIELETALVRFVLGRPVEIHRHGAAVDQRLDLANVVDRDSGREPVLVGWRKGGAIHAGDLDGLVGLEAVGDRLHQSLVPSPHDLRDVAFQLRDVGLRARFIERDHEVHPDQRGLGEGWRKAGDAAAVGLGDPVAHPDPDIGVVAVARQVGEGRNEPVELVAAHEQADARALLQPENAACHVAQGLGIHLEQLVTREILQHVEQPLAGMARLAEAAVGDDIRDLAPHQRDFAGRAGVGGRREQSDHPELTAQAPVGVELLDADVVHGGAAMHGRERVGLGDDERSRLQQEGADLGCHRHHRRAAPQYMGFGVAQDAQPGALHRLELTFPGPAHEFVLAHTQKREVVVQQPFEEGGGLDQLLDRQRRRVLVILRHRLAQARLHRAPVEHGGSGVAEHIEEFAPQLVALRLSVEHAADVDVNEALADEAVALAGFRRDRLQPTGGGAPDADDRVHHQQDLVAAIGQQGERGVDDERHVVVGHLNDRQGAPADVILRGKHANLGASRGALLQEAECRSRQPAELLVGIGPQILPNRILKHEGGQCRLVARALPQFGNDRCNPLLDG